MSKTTKNFLILIVITLAIFAIISAVYQYFKTEPIDANTMSNKTIIDANTGLENMINTLLDEEENVGNEETTNQIEEKEQIEDVDNNMTQRENKAIKLAKEQWKKDWGNLEGVAFNVSVQNDGKYGVTVYDIKTTQSIQFYIVDVDTEIVKER